MNTAIATLLQLTASFLMGVQHNPQATLAIQDQAVAIASNVIQISTQALANIPFTVTPNGSLAPNIEDIYNAPYLNDEGSWVREGDGVTAIASSTSFGDLNNDSIDDAVVLVQKTSAVGTQSFALAALLNQGGILFNVADAQLGSGATIYSHSIANNQLTIDMQTPTLARGVYHYELLGNSFRATQ